jgi:hypothetical protein
MKWDAFAAAIKVIADTRGVEFVKTATHPDPQGEIDAWYKIPTAIGPAGYVTKHGQRHELE